MSSGRRRPLDLTALRERIQDFTAGSGSASTETDDVDDGQDAGADAGADAGVDAGADVSDGPQKPPTEPRVVTETSGEPDEDPVATVRRFARLSRQRADAFYAYAFLPPSVTDDDFGSEAATTAGPDSGSFEGFDLTDWLGTVPVATEPESGTETPTPTEAASGTTVDATEFGTFDVVGWLDAGESGFEPIGIADESADDAVDAPTAHDEPTTPSVTRHGFRPHPAKAATYALFLAVLTLAALSIVGYAPVLGPGTGLGG